MKNHQRRLQMIYRVLFLFYLSASFKNSAATTIITSQDGNWEDSTTWNGYPMTNTVDGDSLFIRHHVNFNGTLMIRYSYMLLDSGGSICGHDTLHLYMSYVMQDGGDAFGKYWDLKSSRWWLADGYMQFTNGGLIWGVGGWTIHGFDPYDTIGDYFGGGFICSNPVIHWEDTTQTDTTDNDSTIVFLPRPPLSIKIYPNPSVDHFIIDSEIPDHNSPVTLGIHDLLGRKMKSIPIPDGKSFLTVFTNNWAAGIYFLRFQQGDIVIQTDKIVRVQ